MKLEYFESKKSQNVTRNKSGKKEILREKSPINLKNKTKL